MEQFYKRLSKCRSKPAILSLIETYSDKYNPVSTEPQFPSTLTDLHKPVFKKFKQ